MRAVLAAYMSAAIFFVFSTSAHAGEECLPAKGREARLISFEADGATCFLYVNDEGMSSGAGSLSCVPNPESKGFSVKRVVFVSKRCPVPVKRDNE